MSKQKEQWKEVLEVLRQGPITPLRAWVDLGVMRVADPIEKLRKRGYLIDTEMVEFTTTRGKHVRFAKYTLVKEPVASGEFVRSAGEAMEMAGVGVI